MRILALLILGSLLSLCAHAQRQQATADSVDNDFVIASLVVADPGDVLYSTVGHVALRMQCPSAHLDYVFSYESEAVPQKVITFLAGNLKMGMFAVPFEEYLSIYKEEQRGVSEYILDLPLEVKRNLWRVCDEHVAQGANLPYDYAERGCAFSTRTIVEEGIATTPGTMPDSTGATTLPRAIDYGTALDSLAAINRRDILYRNLAVSPWTRFFIMFICNGSATDDVEPVEHIIMPRDLVDVFHHARYNGHALITEPARTILRSDHTVAPHWYSPLLVSVLILVLTLLGLVHGRRSAQSNDTTSNSQPILKRIGAATTYTMVGLQTLIGLFACYLVFVSDLVCTEYSALLIPFNVLPALCWRWRRYWALPYALILVAWIVAAIVWPHVLADTPYIVLTVAIMASYKYIYISHAESLKTTSVGT